ncbi:MAG: peroxiredoxin [Parachlamydiaceae bacterium]
MTHIPEVGDRIPDFAIKDYEGIELESDDLIGSPFILYFYPKDDTPGCTKEACSLRDAMDIFDDYETAVIGVSPDNAASHAKFIEKHHLNFTLLCDENLAMAKKFGAIQENGSSILRTTFIIDSQGIIRWIERPVNVEGHSERIINALQSI